ncbi:hypothetical protein [Streptomyces sp. NPDC086023]|uniref:hypothetical protein n=1 Tax=Streptomyces sp. NPDC086023 TaxID=3365746 RepID=UPI0037D8C409
MSFLNSGAVRRPGSALLGAAAMVGLIASPAQASGSWDSYIYAAGPLFESRRWYQGSLDGGTTIKFTGCRGDGDVSVTLAKALDFQPDPYYSTANFTYCFTSSSATSTGNWSDHGAGDYYFVLDVGLIGTRTSVDKVVVSW